MRTPLRPLTRRGLLTGALGSAAMLATGGRSPAAAPRAPYADRGRLRSGDDLSGTEKKLGFSELAAVHRRRREGRLEAPGLDAFEDAQPGSRSTYTEDINDNDEFYGKVRNQLADCQVIGRDIIVLTDWMAARLIRARLDPDARHGQRPQRARRT